MYESGIKYTRTPGELANQLVAWDRSDEAFFAAGACHILAFTFKSLYPDRNLEIVFIKPSEKFGITGTHVYVIDGDWAFDFNGWTSESEILEVTKDAYTNVYPDWDYERVVIKTDLETFCSEHYHRPPAYFAFLPWERTYKFIDKFDAFPSKG